MFFDKELEVGAVRESDFRYLVITERIAMIIVFGTVTLCLITSVVSRFEVHRRNIIHHTRFLLSLQKLLDDHKYEYVLDRACVQFEPDEEEYVRVSCFSSFRLTILCGVFIVVC